MDKAQYALDLATMIRADLGHLAGALEAGHRVEAHRFVDAVVDNLRELEDAVGKAEAQERIRRAE